MRRAMLLLAISSIAFHASGQNKELEALSRANYIERFPDYFFVWPVLKRRTPSFTLENKNNSHQKLMYRANADYYAGFGVYIFEIGFQFAVALPASTAVTNKFGKSNAVDLQANLVGSNWGFEIYNQKYNGYYIDDPNKPIPAGVPLPQRHDIWTRDYGMNGVLFSNKRYSLRSTLNYFERQLKSVGSLLFAGTISSLELRTDSALFDSKYNAEFGEASNIQRLNYSTIGIGPGYGHNFVIKKKWFFAMSLAVGPSLNWLKYQGTGGNWKSNVQVQIFTDIRISLGYNTERFFAGISYIRQSRQISYERVHLTTFNDAVKLAVGYRFREVGILKRRAADFLLPKSR